MSELGRSIPRPALIFGVLGLVPFVAGPVALVLHLMQGSALMGLEGIYSAVILSFLGGARWGFEIVRPALSMWRIGLTMGPSVASFLLAGAGLVFGPDNSLVAAAVLLAFTVLMVLQWLWDAAATDAPPWYGHLRRWLTVPVVVSLGACVIIYFRR